MTRWAADGRVHRPVVTAIAEAEGERIVLRSPRVGLWRGRPAPGSVVAAGGELGELEILGVLHRLVAPADAGGVVVEGGAPHLARAPVDHGAELLVLDPHGAAATAGVVQVAAASRADATGLVFRSPLSGRFYARPAPGEPAFVNVGDVIEDGRTIALLEVMKTFNRLTYGGPGLPARAKIVRVHPIDEADIDEGDPILELQPA